MDDNLSRSAVLALIDQELEKLRLAFEQERERLALTVAAINADKFDFVGPFRCYGIESSILDSYTIQIGKLRELKMKILEIP